MTAFLVGMFIGLWVLGIVVLCIIASANKKRSPYE